MAIAPISSTTTDLSNVPATVTLLLEPQAIQEAAENNNGTRLDDLPMDSRHHDSWTNSFIPELLEKVGTLFTIPWNIVSCGTHWPSFFAELWVKHIEVLGYATSETGPGTVIYTIVCLFISLRSLNPL